MKPSTIEQVGEWHKAFDVHEYTEPTVTDAKLNELRHKLLAEELKELKEALDDGDVIETIDALCDLQYVLDGAWLTLGLSRYKDAAFAEVQRSNMSKLGADGKPVRRADGKVLKGPGFTPPDFLKQIPELEKHTKKKEQ